MAKNFLRVIFLGAAILLGIGLRAAQAQNEFFVANNQTNSVTVYGRTANGNVAPMRTIAGAATGLNSPTALAVDTIHGELVVTNSYGPINVYTRTANGNVAPMRTIGGAAAGLSNSQGLAVDTVNDELLVANLGNNSITVYGRTANGNAAPLRTIVGVTTGLMGPYGLAVDTVNNEVLVANYTSSSITVYARTANGNVAPLRTIVGIATRLTAPRGLAVDTLNNELLVSNPINDSVTAYARTDNGNVAPLRTLAGAATGIVTPESLTIDTINNELAVANGGAPSVTVYARTDNGNVSPLRTLAGPVTRLNVPVSLALTTGAGPSVYQVDPSSGSAAGGTSLGINGTGFQSGATLTIGGIPAVGVSVATPTHIDATSPVLAAGTFNDVVVVNPDLSSATLAEGFFADFLDVPQAYPFHSFVGKLARNKITAGCGGGNYCPGNDVTRAQMAVFLLVSREGSGYLPPACLAPVFSDVPCSSGFARWVNELAARQVTAGCGSNNYCPGNPVTRAQMGVFLLRTYDGPTYTPPACTTAPFADVPCSSPFAPWIQELVVRNITAGCGGGNYCPNSPVTRGQMAVFLSVTFALP